MQTHQIPVEQWQPFLDQFSNQHKGDRVDLELLGGGAAPTSRLCNQPLVGVVAVQERDRDARIDVVAGDQHHPQTHSIRHPAQMTVTQRDDGYPVALQIATNDGAVVSLRFEPEGRNSPYQPPEAFLG